MLLKIFLGLALLFGIYYQLANTGSVADLWSQFISEMSWRRAPFLLLTILLLPMNWYIESCKWHGLMSKFYPIRKRDSLKSVLTGITFGITTPSRIGEYGGRMVFLPAEHNARSIMVTFVTSFAQNIITYTFGFIGLLYFIRHFQPDHFILTGAISFVFVITLGILYLLYFNLDLLTYLKNKMNRLIPKWIHDALSFNEITGRDLRITWLLSLLRYGIYMTQYMLVLCFFGVELEPFLFIGAIASIFLIQGSIPLPPFLGFIARGEIALIIWGYFGLNDLVILGTTYTLFLINLVIPAILGYYFVLNINLIKTFGIRK